MLKMGWISSPYTVKQAAFDLQQKETGSKTVAIATSKACLFYMLAVLHFTNNLSSFCYSYMAAKLPFQFMNKLWLSDFYVSC